MKLKPGEVIMWDAGSSTGVSLHSDDPKDIQEATVITENFEMPADIYHALKKLQGKPTYCCTSCNTILPPSTQPKKRVGDTEPRFICDNCFVKTL